MSDRNACSNSAAVRMKFTGAPIYTIAPGVDKLGIQDYLRCRLAHLEAMLAAICGEGFKLFQFELDDERKEEYLWGCSTLAEECKELSAALNAIE